MTRPKGPQKIGSIVSQLMARRGYARVQAADEVEQVWQECVGGSLGAHTRTGNVRRGTLLVIVTDSVSMQELTFSKRRLLKTLQSRLPSAGIKDIRFQLGQL